MFIKNELTDEFEEILNIKKLVLGQEDEIYISILPNMRKQPNITQRSVLCDPDLFS